MTKPARIIVIEALVPSLRGALAENRADMIIKKLEAEGYRIIHSAPAERPDEPSDPYLQTK